MGRVMPLAAVKSLRFCFEAQGMLVSGTTLVVHKQIRYLLVDACTLCHRVRWMWLTRVRRLLAPRRRV